MGWWSTTTAARIGGDRRPPGDQRRGSRRAGVRSRHRVDALAQRVAPLSYVSTVSVLEHVVASSTRKRPRTIDAYLHAVKSYLGYVRDAAFTGASVEAWRDAMALSGLAPVTVNARLAGLKFASRRYEALGFGPDFARAAEPVQVVWQKKRFAPRFEVGQRLVDACRGSSPMALRDRAMIVLALRTGMRRESLAELMIEDVEIDRPAATVIIKGGRRYRVRFDAEEAGTELATWLRWLDAVHGITTAHVFRSLRQGIDGWIVGDRLHPTSINRIFKHRAEIAGLHFHPHLARHAFVSWADAAGMRRSEIMAVTGHLDERSLAAYLDPDIDDAPVVARIPPLLAGRAR